MCVLVLWGNSLSILTHFESIDPKCVILGCLTKKDNPCVYWVVNNQAMFDFCFFIKKSQF